MKIEDILNLTEGVLTNAPKVQAIQAATVYPSKVDHGDLFFSSSQEEIDLLKKYLITHFYPHVPNKVKNEFEKYFLEAGIRNNYSGIRFNSEHQSNNLNNVISRVNGKYLNYIYPFNLNEHIEK